MRLFIPGPVNVEEDVLKIMSSPMISHRSKSASCLQQSISKNMQILWNTKNSILLSTSSGSGLMEAAVKSLILKKGVFFSLGAFGKRWYEMAIANGKEADIYEVEDKDLKYGIEWIIPNAQKNIMEPILITLDEDGRYKEEAAHEGEEFGYVLQGTINIHIGKKKYKAKKGESFYYKPRHNHYISNASKAKAKVLWISTPPSF